MERNTNSYGVEEVMEVIETLSHYQGFYGRLLEKILYLQEHEPEQFERFKKIVEEQKFKDPVDVVLFFET